MHSFHIITAKSKIGMTIKNEPANSAFPDSDPARAATGQEERTRLRVGSVSPILGMHGPHHCGTPYLAN